jgi:hypothetical protein
VFTLTTLDLEALLHLQIRSAVDRCQPRSALFFLGFGPLQGSG